MTPHSTSLEPLEARLAPAAVFTFTDVDGDRVSITTTLGDNDSLADAVTVGDLTEITLDDTFAGTSINIQATRMDGGDGHVHIGLIDATDIDLKNVTVDGDLGAIIAGDGDDSVPALTRLHVRSFGAAPDDLQYSETTQIDEAVTIKILHDCFATISAGHIGTITIGGSLGSDGTTSGHSEGGSIVVQDGIDAVTIRGDVASDLEKGGGRIVSAGPIGALLIRGSLIGEQSGNGTIEATSFGTVEVRGSLIGNPLAGGPCAAITATEGGIDSLIIGGGIVSFGDAGGFVDAAGDIGFIQIGGDILATVDNTGSAGFFYADTLDGLGGAYIHAGGDIGSVLIGGSVGGRKGPVGPDAFYSPSLSGGILAEGRIDHVIIGGDLIGGSNNDSDPENGATDYCGFIKAHALGTVTIGGDLLSSHVGLIRHNGIIQSDTTIDSVSIGGRLIGNGRANIVAGGLGAAASGTDLAIGSIFIGGRVKNAGILAGYITDFDDFDENDFSRLDHGIDADAQIGSVTVGASWQHSFLAAGIDPGNDRRFATGDDAKLSGSGIHDDPAMFSQIAAITIGGGLRGTGLGFVAENIVAAHIPRTRFHLHTGAHNDDLTLRGHTHLLEV